MSFSRDGRREWTFWKPSRQGDINELEPAIELMSRTLDEVVGDQLVSDVPLSILQSGGIDSSLISLSVGRKRKNVPLFTAGFDEPTHDEVDLARRVANAAGLPHQVIPVERSKDLCTTFRSVVYHFDGQCADAGALGIYSLSAAVRKYSTVVLSGDGGDEFVCGYQTYGATRVAEFVRRVIPSSLARGIGTLAYRLGPNNESRLPGQAIATRFAFGLAEGGERPHLEWRRLVPATLTRTVYGPGMKELAGATPYGEYARYYDSIQGSVLDRAMLADQRFHLQSILQKVDAMSMAHSLEVRVPLLDRRIMDIAARLQTGLLLRRGSPKFLLRVLAQRLGAPLEVTTARKKGFNVPIARLLRSELMPLANQVLERDADVLSPYLQPDAIRTLWREHRDRRANHAFALWPILTLGVWLAGLARPARQFERSINSSRSLEPFSPQGACVD